MAQKFTALLLAVALVMTGFGCATTNPDGTPGTAASTAGGAVGGAVLGAAMGALLGLATGDVAKGAAYGAIAGATAGAVAGFAYAKHQEKVFRDRQTAEAMYKYQAEQGERVVVENVGVTPNASTPGDMVAMNSDFTVLNGSDQPVNVDITQAITYQGKQMGRPFTYSSERQSGSYSIAIPTKIPANAPDGTYTVVTQIKSPNAVDEKTCEFSVAKKTASDQREIRLVSISGVPVNN